MIGTEDWQGDFGNDYTDRQDIDTTGRGYFWEALVDGHEINSAVEVGCSDGRNLWDLKIPCTGVDVNEVALALVPDWVRTVKASATELPFATDTFDLAFTFGVLIHIPPEDIDEAMRQLIRVSRRYVFCGEYAGDDEIPYRGGVLWRRDYGDLYQDIGLKLLDTGTLEGPPWDRGEVTWWLLEQERRDA